MEQLEGAAAGGGEGSGDPPAGAPRSSDAGGDGVPVAGGSTGPPDPPPPDVGALRNRRRLVRSFRVALALVVLFFVAEYLLLPDVTSAGQSISRLGRVDVAGLVVGVLLEFCALGAYAQLTHTVLSPDPPPRWRLLRVNMSSLAVSHVLPGGTAPGAAVAYRLLTESGVSGSTAAFGLATQGVGSAVVLNVIFWVFLLISIPLRGYNPLYGFAAIAGALLLAAFGGVVLLLTRGARQAADRLHHLAVHLPFVNADRISSLVQNVADRLAVLLRNRHLLTSALLWAAANWLLDAGSLWVLLLAFGHAISPVDLLVAYGLANILAVIPITPSGLGVVEGVLIPTLSGFGVPKTVAILGVLAWRLVNFWLPIPMGGLSYLSLRLGPVARRRRATGPAGSPADCTLG
ncbi:MAG TPA: YbhN family protein [Acidimicrobiales bacterium]|jgi:hypothetical protein